MKTILWIGGWASHFDCLRPHLLPLAPDAVWIAIDPHEVSLQPSQLSSAFASLTGLGGSTMILAWSLGAMHVLRYLQVTGKELPVPALLLNPIARLVGPGAPWPERALTRMRRKLADAPEVVLGEFWDLMASHGQKPSLIPPDFAATWLKTAQSLPITALNAGLENLGKGLRNRVDEDPAGHSLWLMGDSADPIAPFDPEHWRASYPEAKVLSGQGGHLPFFGDRELLQTCIADIWRAQPA